MPRSHAFPRQNVSIHSYDALVYTLLYTLSDKTIEKTFRVTCCSTLGKRCSTGTGRTSLRIPEFTASTERTSSPILRGKCNHGRSVNIKNEKKFLKIYPNDS